MTTAALPSGATTRVRARYMRSVTLWRTPDREDAVCDVPVGAHVLIVTCTQHGLRMTTDYAYVVFGACVGWLPLHFLDAL